MLKEHKELYIKFLLNKGLDATHNIQFTVNGTSMLPCLQNGDSVNIKRFDIYDIGDILVFNYSNVGLLIHRLIKIDNSKFYFKGDNTFHLECVLADQILGKVIHIKRNDNFITLPSVNSDFIELSLKVNDLYKYYNYDYKKIIKNNIYLIFKERYLECFHT